MNTVPIPRPPVPIPVACLHPDDFAWQVYVWRFEDREQPFDVILFRPDGSREEIPCDDADEALDLAAAIVSHWSGNPNAGA